MKRRIRKMMVVLLLLGSASMVFAQGGKPSKEEMEEKIKVLKISYLTARLDLTEAEAQKFWPIYNAFEEEMKDFRPPHPGEAKPDIEAMSDAEIENKINEMFKNQYQRIELEEAYFQKFKAVIPLQKVMKMYKAEKDFKKEIIEKFKEHKKGPPQD